MARHVDPDDTSFRRSLLKAVAGGVVALVVTFGVTAVLTVVGRDAGTGPVVLDGGTPAPTGEPTAAPTTTDPPSPAPGATPAPTEDPTADEPAAVTVQVLDAVGSGTHAEDAAAALRDLGYEVIVVNDTPRRVDVTRILATPGHEADAEALRERDDRFAQIAVNNDFNPDVDLHVLVGPDFQ